MFIVCINKNQSYRPDTMACIRTKRMILTNTNKILFGKKNSAKIDE